MERAMSLRGRLALASIVAGVGVALTMMSAGGPSSTYNVGRGTTIRGTGVHLQPSTPFLFPAISSVEALSSAKSLAPSGHPTRVTERFAVVTDTDEYSLPGHVLEIDHRPAWVVRFYELCAPSRGINPIPRPCSAR